MLQGIVDIYGSQLAASDGDIGHVKDFYFDDESWVIRYVIADTGNWLSGRQVLISPHAIGFLHHIGKVLPASLSRKQIEDSPSIDLHLPVTRQHEEEYYQYFGWPNYWQGDSLWGMSGFPLSEMPARPPLSEASAQKIPHSRHNDTHLRSTQSVKGYYLAAHDQKIGHVVDFLVDPQSWAVLEIVVRTGHWFSSREVRIPTNKVNRISFENSTIYVDLTRDEIEDKHPHESALATSEL